MRGASQAVSQGQRNLPSESYSILASGHFAKHLPSISFPTVEGIEKELMWNAFLMMPGLEPWACAEKHHLALVRLNYAAFGRASQTCGISSGRWTSPQRRHTRKRGGGPSEDMLFAGTLAPGDILITQPGWAVAERVIGDSLCSGLRRSLIERSHQTGAKTLEQIFRELDPSQEGKAGAAFVLKIALKWICDNAPPPPSGDQAQLCLRGSTMMGASQCGSLARFGRSSGESEFAWKVHTATCGWMPPHVSDWGVSLNPARALSPTLRCACPPPPTRQGRRQRRQQEGRQRQRGRAAATSATPPAAGES